MISVEKYLRERGWRKLEIKYKIYFFRQNDQKIIILVLMNKVFDS